MIYKNDILNVKENIIENLGQRVIVKGSLGRSKPFEREATLEKAYPNIFVVRYDNEDRNITYTYTDLLTRTVELDMFDGEKYLPLVPPLEPKKKKELF